MKMMPQPWPGPLGAENAGRTPVVLALGGQVRWSIELPVRTLWYLLAAADNRWAAGGQNLIAGGDQQGVTWQRHEPCSPPALQENGGSPGVAVARGAHGMALLNLDDGSERWAREGFHAVVAAAGAAIASIAIGEHERSLVLLEPNGALRWSHPVDHPIGTPLAWENTIVFASAHEVTAFSLGGKELWRASPLGFGVPAANKEDVLSTHPFALDERRIAIGARTGEWRGYLIVDPSEQSADPWRLPNGAMVADELPVAVRRIPPKPLAIISHQLFRVGITALDGTEVGDWPLPAAPSAFAVDPTGAVAVAYSLDATRHDKYLWHDEGRAVHGRSGITIFEPDGRPRWTWDAPGPLGGFAVNAAGEILVTSEGRLWAIG